MKKKTLALLLVLAMTFSLAACGDDADNSSTDNTVSEENNANADSNVQVEGEGIVEMGQYKGLTVEAAKYVPAEDELNYYIEAFYQEEALGFEFNKQVEEGDLVILDYVGTIDGVAFEGGTAQDASLLIGSDSFIDGFEDGMVGMELGEVRDLNLKFPDDYYNTDYAGKECVFNVTVKQIIPPMSDETIAVFQNENYSNVEEFKEFSMKTIDEYFNSDFETDIITSVLDQIINSTTFGAMPEDLMEKHRGTVTSAYSAVAQSYGMDLDSYLTYNNTSLDEMAGLFAKRDLIFATIAENEGISVTAEEVEQSALDIIAQYYNNDITLEEFYEQQDGVEGYTEYCLIQKVYDYLLENTNVVDPAEVGEAAVEG